MRPTRRRPVRAALGSTAVAATIVVSAISPVAPAAAESTGRADDAARKPAAAAGSTTAAVTLLTGDTVNVTTAGGRTSVTAAPGDRQAASFQSETTPDGDVYVYPDSALGGIASGKLDRELFNVTGLIAAGYDDAHRATIPVIVSYKDEPSARALDMRTESLADASARPLASIDAAATSLGKKDTDEFFDALGTGDDRPAKAAREIKKVWLDQQVKPLLEKSVPQIGAPDAWAAGYDGKGVKVAVLDTGADLDHPDLAGRISASESFVPTETVPDKQGHGTHVAATIAGSGAASGGLRKGVAPGADLIVGKVLSNSGSGDSSWVLAGMEWAAAQGADVISMSLGGDGTPNDVLSQAVNRLSEQYGTLFVIAAGNAGPGAGTVRSPGLAARALTVGAVDGDDKMAPFSSRGPGNSGGSLKPEISAPGVGIVAARADGTSLGTPVDDNYTSLSGTSMATPHVAGAAAIMAQIHPDMNGEQLKNALASTAKNLPVVTPFDEGAGRVDLTNGIRSTVFASAKADFGTFIASDTPTDPLNRTITYTNIGDKDVTLSLGLDMDRGVDTVEDEVRLSSGTVTVPAHGTADVTLSVDQYLGGYSHHSGFVHATADGARLVTAVGYIRWAPQADVTVHLADRNGKAPALATIQVFDMVTDDVVFRSATLQNQDSYSVTVPKGRYSVIARLRTDVNGTESASDFYAEPEIDLAKDMEVSIDARKAVDVRARVADEKRPTADSWYSTSLTRTRPGNFVGSLTSYGLAGDRVVTEGVIPSESTAETGTLTFGRDTGLRDPLVTAEADLPGPDRLSIVTPALGMRKDTSRHLKSVPVGGGSDADYSGRDVRGRLAVITTMAVDVSKLVDTAVAKGAAGVLIARPETGSGAITDIEGRKIPVFATTQASSLRLLRELSRRPVTVEVATRAESRFTYLVPLAFQGALPARPVMTTYKKQYAVTENHFYSDLEPRLANETMSAWHPWGGYAFRTRAYMNAPATRQEYVYAPDMTYQQSVHSGRPGTEMREPVAAFKAGQKRERDWYRGPVHAGTPQLTACAFCRTPERITFAYTTAGDSESSHWGMYGATAMTARYYRDDTKIDNLAELLVPEEATYRMEYDVTRALGSGVRLGTEQKTAWTFRSAAPKGVQSDECRAAYGNPTDCSTLPVILTGFDVPVDALNRADAGERFGFTLTTSRQAGYTGDEDIAGAKVSVSYDDGATWRLADVRVGDEGSHRVSVRHPSRAETNGFVALRVEVWDDAGNRTTQTVKRAYALD
ncbi:S8 family serine peptidase [Streptomyces sp. NPDC056452]|uniref:S8 family peptidase n=1 Tax=Streptomyces sp. NPDC056452 TaxID=3345821 RepID=UPI0036776DA5